jgi:hypothetical protein
MMPKQAFHPTACNLLPITLSRGSSLMSTTLFARKCGFVHSVVFCTMLLCGMSLASLLSRSEVLFGATLAFCYSAQASYTS